MSNGPEASPKRVQITGTVTLGSILQTLTLIGGMVSSVYAAGSYVQSLRDDLRKAEQAKSVDGKELCSALRQLARELAQRPRVDIGQ